MAACKDRAVPLAAPHRRDGRTLAVVVDDDNHNDCMDTSSGDHKRLFEHNWHLVVAVGHHNPMPLTMPSQVEKGVDSRLGPSQHHHHGLRLVVAVDNDDDHMVVEHRDGEVDTLDYSSYSCSYCY